MTTSLNVPVVCAEGSGLWNVNGYLACLEPSPTLPSESVNCGYRAASTHCSHLMKSIHQISGLTGDTGWYYYVLDHL